MRDWKRREQYPGGYRGRNMEFLIENFRLSAADSRVAEQVRLSGDTRYRESLYEPSLRYFIYNAMNLVEGNYERGLRAYIDWKRSLGS